MPGGAVCAVRPRHALRSCRRRTNGRAEGAGDSTPRSRHDWTPNGLRRHRRLRPQSCDSAGSRQMSETTATLASTHAAPLPAGRYGTLALLTLVTTFNIFDKALFQVMADPIK